jgi:ADP-dependent NAD(P)H-hydrate dehydratase / NAD(P)H-hydrate epimerase
MIKVLSAAEMQACDRATSERFGIPSIDLMRAASAAVANFARLHFPRARRVTVLCGRGNNGGDGMMTARLLAEAGLEVTTVLAGSPEGITGDAAIAWRELTTPMHGCVHAVTAPEEFARNNDALNCDLLIDALLGTGFNPPMKGLALAALEWSRACSAPILAIDLPSGWPADSTNSTCDGAVFPADAVVTFTAPKPAHVFGELTRRWNQPVVVAPIGSPPEAIEAAIISSQQLTWAGASLELVQRPRVADANKGKFGHVLAVGGTFGSAGGKSGAPTMMSLAALRSGAGLVTAAVPAPALTAVASHIPELMTWPLDATSDGHIAAANAAPDRIAAFTAGKTVLAIGPGMGQSAETTKFLLELLRATNMPAVLDADALNILAARAASLAELAKSRSLILTPHPGEMARLAGISTAEVQSNRLEIARSFAQRHGVTLVLKGARTLIAHPDGRVAVNTSGNPGMAKGGSGDLLTGMIAGILAQHPAEPAQAVEAAVYLHGLAADFAVHATDEHTLLATDSLRFLSHAFQFQSFDFRKTTPSDYVWLQGHCMRPDDELGMPR